MRLISGDCIEAMRKLPEASVDAIVTDPPYGLGFMGKAWDDLPPGEEWARECLRVLKPGGHLLAFGGSRTYHRLACAVEDAGFEVRDQMMWCYGSGFPKSKNVALAIDKGEGHLNRGRAIPTASSYQACDTRRENKLTSNRVGPYEPRSSKATNWQGWGTALKPAHEPIVVARKPLAGTVAENVLRFGTGALNIDGCRIEGDAWKPHTATGLAKRKFFTDGDAVEIEKVPHDAGRWPANVVMDEEAGRLLDEQSGELKGQVGMTKTKGGHRFIAGDTDTVQQFDHGLTDTGGASRFFYCAKASKGERNAGLDALPDKVRRRVNSGGLENDPRWAPVIAKNNHPTVKPISLMRYLVRLVTPPEGTVLDPFLGSGTTGCAAVLEGFDFIGIEREAEYLAIAEARIVWWEKHRGDGETDEILKAAGVRDEIEAGGQLGLLDEAA